MEWNIVETCVLRLWHFFWMQGEQGEAGNPGPPGEPGTGVSELFLCLTTKRESYIMSSRLSVCVCSKTYLSVPILFLFHFLICRLSRGDYFSQAPSKLGCRCSVLQVSIGYLGVSEFQVCLDVACWVETLLGLFALNPAATISHEFISVHVSFPKSVEKFSPFIFI